MSPFDLITADAVEALAALPDACIDLIVTDVAYESLEKHRARGTTTRLKVSNGSSNAWFPIFPNARFPELFAQMYRVLKPDRHLYFFCDPETQFIAKPIGEAVGFKFWKPLIWDKKRIGMGYHYRGRYEMILFFEKGKRRLNDLGIGDILEASRVVKGYPTEKPVSISKTLIAQSTQPGELVLDPFTGSGSVGVAALQLGRRFIGCDIGAQAVANAIERLKREGEPTSEAQAQPVPPEWAGMDDFGGSDDPRDLQE